MIKYYFVLLCALCMGTTAIAAPLVEKITPIKIATTVRGHGKVLIVLDTKRNFSDTQQEQFFQGKINHRGRDIPVAASFINNTYRIVFPGKFVGSSGTHQRLFTLRLNKQLEKIRAFGIPHSAYGHKTCGDDHDGHITTQSLVANPIVENVRILSISTFADPEWQARYGERSNAEILSIINIAEAIYDQQLNIRFLVQSQTLLQTPSPQNDIGYLLNEFRQYPETQTTSNVKYLFTGKDVNGLTIGLAYIGTVCYAPNYAYGVVQSYGSYTGNIFAHEVGHNLNATHDTSQYNNIMFPSVSSGEVFFTQNSLQQINSFLDLFGSCVLQQTTLPSLSGAKIVLTRSRRIVVARLTSTKQLPIANQLVTLTINKKKVTRTTNVDGVVFYRIPKNKKTRYKITAYVNDIIQDNISFRI